MSRENLEIFDQAVEFWRVLNNPTIEDGKKKYCAALGLHSIFSDLDLHPDDMNNLIDELASFKVSLNEF